MIIALSGLPGAGKSTLAQGLEKALGYKRYYIGGMRREIAAKMGISLEELNRRDEQEQHSDRLVDAYIKELAAEQDNIIIEGRMAFHFAPKSVKLFLTVQLEEGARRIFEEIKAGARQTEPYKSYEEVLSSLKKRIESDKRRYMECYGVDGYNPELHDIVIDTTHKSIPEVIEEALSKLRKAGVRPLTKSL